MMKTVGDALSAGKIQLEKANIENPQVDVEYFLSDLLSCNLADLFLNKNIALTADQVVIFENFLFRRSQHEPLAYIQAKKNFMGMDFYVDSHVLIPRPETELLVENSISWIREKQLKHPKILDIGTGSGCMAVCLAKNLPGAEISAVDISSGALKVAKKNAKIQSVFSQIQFFEGSLYEPFGANFRDYFDIIVSNPPYVSSLEMKDLEKDLGFEPQGALFAGAEGLDFVRPIIQNAGRFLKSGGSLFIEVGFKQSQKVLEIFSQNKFKNIRALKDYAGYERIVTGDLNGSI